MSERRRPFKKFGNRSPRRQPAPSTEDKVKNFVVRNSRNGFFTKIKTLAFKFEISEDEANAIAGSLLADNVLECVHDERGDAKLCEVGKSITVLQKERERRSQKPRGPKKKASKK